MLPTLINALDKVSLDGSYEIASCILNIIFDGKSMPRPITVDELSEEQRLGLDAIANSKQFWSGYSEKCSLPYHVAEMLEDSGLPIRRERLKSFMAGELTLEEHDKLDTIASLFNS